MMPSPRCGYFTGFFSVSAFFASWSFFRHLAASHVRAGPQ
jgi:hypothetical protein